MKQEFYNLVAHVLESRNEIWIESWREWSWSRATLYLSADLVSGEKRDKKLTFGPKIQILGSKKHIFAPNGQLEPQWSMFSTRKRCLIRIPIWGYQNFYSLPPKIGFWAQKRPNLAQNWHFGPNIGIFGPFDLMPDQKTMRTSCLDGFLLCWYQNFYLLP